MKHGRRTFTAAYKTQIVLEWLGNPSSQTEICRRELLSLETLKQWKEQYLLYLLYAMQPFLDVDFLRETLQ